MEVHRRIVGLYLFVYYFQLAPFKKKKKKRDLKQFIIKKKTAVLRKKQLPILDELYTKSIYLLFLPVLDHKPNLNPEIIPTLSLE